MAIKKRNNRKYVNIQNVCHEEREQRKKKWHISKMRPEH